MLWSRWMKTVRRLCLWGAVWVSAAAQVTKHRRTRWKSGFRARPDQLSDRFQQLITSIPLPHFLMSERIINHAKIALGKELSDSIYVTLPDHISAAVNRYKEGIVLPNPLLWDIRQLYKDEFRVGLKANEIVKEETGVEFTDDEAAFIALHFVNAQLGGEIRDIYDMTYLMKAGFGIVYDEYGFGRTRESLNYYRFVTHLKFYARRIVSGEKYGDEDADLLEVVRFSTHLIPTPADHIRAHVQNGKGFHSDRNEALLSHHPASPGWSAPDENDLETVPNCGAALFQQRKPWDENFGSRFPTKSACNRETFVIL